MFLRWLLDTEGLNPTDRPIDRVTQDRVAAFVKSYEQGRSDHTVALGVRHIAFTVRATEPPDGLPWLSKLAYRLTATAVPATSKVSKLVPIADLLDLGAQLMEDAVAELEQGKLRGAMKFRDGLIISALATRPLRSGSFLSLRIGESLSRGAHGVHVRLAEHETKTERAEDFSYPEWLSPAFRTYLKHARPILLKGASRDNVWIGIDGTALLYGGLYNLTCKLTELHRGRAISPHLFRHCAATSIANDDPDHAGIIKTVLSHASIKTGESFYNQATMLTAARRHHDVIANMRAKARRR
jgi:integrase/recombinase XerC